MTTCPGCERRQPTPALVACVPDIFTGTGTYPVFRCGSCMLLFTGGELPPPEVLYPAEYLPYAGPRESRAHLTQWLEPLQARSSRLRAVAQASGIGPVLDLGCGNGTGVRLLSRKGVTAFGLDISREALAAAPAGKVAVGGPIPLPIRDGVLGGIMLHHVLEHSDAPFRLLLEVARILAPGGRARIAVPVVAEGSLTKEALQHPGWDVPRHRVHFTSETLAALLRRAGLRQIDARYRPEPAFRLLSSPRAGTRRGRAVQRGGAYAAELRDLTRLGRSSVLEINAELAVARRQAGPQQQGI